MDNEQEIKAEDIGQDVVTYVNRILAEAFIKGVSDIHVEPYEKGVPSSFPSGRVSGGDGKAS